MGSMPWHSTSLVNIIEVASQLRWVSTGSRRAHRQLLGWAMLLAVLNVAYAWPVMGICVELVSNDIDGIDDEQGRTIINSRPQESIVVTHLADRFHDLPLLLSATA